MDFTCREDTLSRKPILLEVYSYILLDIWTSFCPGVSEPDVRNLVQLLILKSHFWCHCNNKDSRAERDRRKEVRRSRRKKKNSDWKWRVTRWQSVLSQCTHTSPYWERGSAMCLWILVKDEPSSGRKPTNYQFFSFLWRQGWHLSCEELQCAILSSVASRLLMHVGLAVPRPSFGIMLTLPPARLKYFGRQLLAATLAFKVFGIVDHKMWCYLAYGVQIYALN